MANITDNLELIGREAELASKTVGTGLTELRKYSLGGFGYFYSGLFSLTIGIERMAKLVILLDYYNKNNQSFPENDSHLKKLCHNLEKLIDEVKKVNSASAEPATDALFEDQLTLDLVTIISDFARFHRFYNLDILQGCEYSANEPLARWDKQINSEILKRHFHLSESLDRQHSSYLSMQPATVFFTKEDGEVINDIEEYADYMVRVDCKQKYSSFYCYRVVRFISQVFRQVDQLQFGHIFSIYRAKDSYAKRRKTWNPYRP